MPEATFVHLHVHPEGSTLGLDGRRGVHSRKIRRQVEDLYQRRRNFWRFVAESQEAGVPVSPEVSQFECERFERRIAHAWVRVRRAERDQWTIAMNGAELYRERIEALMQGDDLGNNGRSTRVLPALDTEEWVATAKIDLHDPRTADFLHDGGWVPVETSTGNPEGRQTHGATNGTMITSRLEELTGCSIAELRTVLRPGKPNAHMRATRMILGPAVCQLVEARERPVNRKALADVLGCSVRTVDRLASSKSGWRRDG
ncbi:MAG: hypothetical protein ACXVRV_07525 [Gaiellaceae bacterium]